MEDKIKSLLRRKYKNIDISLLNHIQNHICILISGYLEKEFTTILVNYKSSSHFSLLECKDTNRVKNMSNRAGSGIQNAKWCAIRPILYSIDLKIIKRLYRLKDFELTIINSINNIVMTRHKIAHGENVTNLTLQVLRNDFKNIQKFLKQLKKIFLDYT